MFERPGPRRAAGVTGEHSLTQRRCGHAGRGPEEEAVMRRYDDPVEVRGGVVSGSTGPVEAPEQFLWRGGLWKVVDVVAHWVETGPWWQSPGVAALLGDDGDPPADTATTSDLLAE